MVEIELWLSRINIWVWGAPLLVLLIGTGIYLTILLRGLQFRYLPYAFKLVFSNQNFQGQGDITHFQALMTALAATIGVGTIAGVATAIAVGGLGAIFWMVVVGLIGMATKYSEAILAQKYRIVDKFGKIAGGPMYYLERGLKVKWLGKLFAFFGAVTAIGTGNLVQAHSVADALSAYTSIDSWFIGIILAVCVALVILGGITHIGRVSSILVPFMALFYMVGGLYIIILNIQVLPNAVYEIVHSAFTGQAACGGFFGCTMMMALQEGVSKGIFSNESGLGSAPIAAAAAKSDYPGRQAMVSMMGTFFTIIVTTITGLVIAVTGVLGQFGTTGKLLNGAPLTIHAFDISMPGGGVLLSFGLILFAFSTIVGWAYYGERCFEYLLGYRSVFIYRILFTLMVIPGAALTLKTVWSFSGIMNGLMAIPNLIALLGLSGIIASNSNAFLKIIAKENTK